GVGRVEPHVAESAQRSETSSGLSEVPPAGSPGLLARRSGAGSGVELLVPSSGGRPLRDGVSSRGAAATGDEPSPERRAAPQGDRPATPRSADRPGDLESRT